jgi:hypothetical protein
MRMCIACNNLLALEAAAVVAAVAQAAAAVAAACETAAAALAAVAAVAVAELEVCSSLDTLQTRVSKCKYGSRWSCALLQLALQSLKEG